MITPEFEEWYLSQFPEDQQDQARANLEGARKWEALQAQTAESNNETVPDYYALLGVPRFYATQDEISTAYMAQFKFLYANLDDITPEIVNERTQRLNEAYETLQETAKKRQYDEMLAKYMETATTAKKMPAHDQENKGNAVAKKDNVRPKRKKLVIIAVVVFVAISAAILFAYFNSTSPQASAGAEQTSLFTEEELDEWRALYFSKRNDSEETATTTPPYKSDFFNSGKYDVSDQVEVPTKESEETLDTYTKQERRDKLRELASEIIAKETGTAPTVPENGEIIYQKFGTNSTATGPLEVETSGNNDYFVKLRNHSTGEEVLSFYVYAESSVEVEVPLGNYDITYACGFGWYGPDELFGEETVCYKADSTFSFYIEDGYVNGWTLTLYPVVNGNLDTDVIDVSVF